MSEAPDDTEWSSKELRTVEALMAQGLSKQRRVDQYTAPDDHSDPPE